MGPTPMLSEVLKDLGLASRVPAGPCRRAQVRSRPLEEAAQASTEAWAAQ